MKVTYLGIRSAHERVWLVEWKPIWLPRAYLTRGDLEPARGNLHVCKFLFENKFFFFKMKFIVKSIINQVPEMKLRIALPMKKQSMY